MALCSPESSVVPISDRSGSCIDIDVTGCR